MRKLVIALAATFVAIATYAQGSFVFDNLVIDYKVQRPDGTPPGATLKAEVLLVNADNSLTSLSTTPFYGTDVPLAARFYNIAPDNAVVVSSVAPGGTANLRFRAYDGSTYANSTIFGETSFVQGLGGGTITPPNLGTPDTNPITASLLAGKTLTLTVPEPTTLAFGALGAAALLFRRRK